MPASDVELTLRLRVGRRGAETGALYLHQLYVEYSNGTDCLTAGSSPDGNLPPQSVQQRL